MTDGAIETVMGQTSQEQIRLVRFLYADHGGIIRGKASGTGHLRERMASGIGHTVAMMAMSMLDQLQPVPGMGPVGEVRILPDPGTFVALPYAPGAGAMLADLVKPDGSPWEACARTFLKQAIVELAGEGYAMQAAFEPEFTVGRRESSPAGPSIPDRLIPIDDSLCYSSTGFHLAHDFAMELVEALEAQGLVVEHYYPELGHGQHEMSIRYADALRAADNHVLYRETVRGVAFRHGLWASLAPKPIPDQAGNGTHLHGSLIDLSADGEPGGRNVFADPADRNGLSQIGYHFIGGLLAHLPALVALTCASVNSYRRLAPQMWASAYTCYGMDNREAAIRICSPLRGDAGSSVNLELKPSDSSANPYLALGAFIYAGLDGIRSKIDPGEALNVDPSTLSEAERAERGAHRLPASLAAALDALSADALLMDALGPLRSTAYLAVKRSEAAHFAHSTDPYYECFQHFTKILGKGIAVKRFHTLAVAGHVGNLPHWERAGSRLPWTALEPRRRTCNAEIVRMDMMWRAGSQPTEPTARHEVTTGDGTARRPGWWRGVWQRLVQPPDAELVLGQLNRQLAVLEGARAELDVSWVQGGWWATRAADGSARLVTGYAAAGGHPDHVDGVCLIGTLVRAGSGWPDARSDVGRAVDAVYDALWASRGQPGAPVYRGLPPVPPPDVRLARVRTLTRWNDQAGRTRAEVLGVVDRAISATIMGLMSAPRSAQAGPVSASVGVRTG